MVRATIVDAHKATIKAIPSGISILPSIPDKKNNGTKLTMIINVEFNIGIRTSFDASKTTLITDFLSSGIFVLFSRKFLYTFSTSTIASSTKDPIAIASPPKLIVFIVRPMNFNVKIDANKDNVIVIKDIVVVLIFIKKKKSTITTKMVPSYNDFFTLSIELFIKRS